MYREGTLFLFISILTNIHYHYAISFVSNVNLYYYQGTYAP